MEIRDLINYGGFTIGILGIVLSIYLYKKGIERKDPRCYYRTYKNISKLSEENDSKIRIFYDQDEVTRVFTTYVWIWNSGKIPISKSDIPVKQSLRISLKDDEFPPKILNFDTIKTSRNAINFSVTRDSDTSLVFSFDFLDQDDGAIIEIQHTGSGETELETDGIILGVPDGLKILETRNRRSRIFRVAQRINSVMDMKKNPKRTIIFLIVMLLMFALMVGWSYYQMKTDLKVSVSTEELHEVISKELPQVTTENITNIVNTISEDSIKSQRIFLLALVGYFALLSGMVIYLAWMRFKVPYPKIFQLDDDFIRYTGN